MHFKELFALDGKEANLTDNDIERRNTIAHLLSDWGLIAIINKTISEKIKRRLSQIKKFYHLKKKVNGTYKQNIT